MTRAELRTIETYCSNQACGEPISGLSRASRYTKRQMVFSGFKYFFYANYRCPVCGSTRLFRLSLFETHYVETNVATAWRETKIGFAAILVILVAFWVADTLRLHARARALDAEIAERKLLHEAATLVTEDLVEIKPEFAEVIGSD